MSGGRVGPTGHYKRILPLDAVLLILWLAPMNLMDEPTALALVGLLLVIIEIAVVMLTQNLILAVQNTIPLQAIGAGSALIAFFRSLGGAIGVSALGAVLSSKVSSSLSGGGGGIPDLSSPTDPLKGAVEHAYGTGVAEIFLVAAPMGIVAFAALWLLREQQLGTRSGIELGDSRGAAR